MHWDIISNIGPVTQTLYDINHYITMIIHWSLAPLFHDLSTHWTNLHEYFKILFSINKINVNITYIILHLHKGFSFWSVTSLLDFFLSLSSQKLINIGKELPCLSRWCVEGVDWLDCAAAPHMNKIALLKLPSSK